jgi:predicted permease
VALGASRLALFRQFLVESLLLAGIGGAAAWGITLLLIRLLSGHITAEGGSLPTNVHPDIVVFAFSVAITVAAALSFGTWPAWKASQVRPLSQVRGAIGGSRRGPLVSRGIVCAQLALSLALLFCGGLFTRTLSNLRSIDLGFSPENLIFLQPRLEGTTHAGRGAIPFFEDVLRRAEGLPAIRAASLGVFSPLSGSTLGAPVSIEGYGSPGQPAPRALMHYVSNNYFRTMGVPLLSGDDFPRGVTPDTPGSVIINEEFSRRYFGGASLGKIFKVGNSERRVIGVVGTTKYRSMREEPEPIFYQPLGGITPKVLLVRTTGDSTQRILELRSLIQTIDSSVAIDSIVTMEDQLDGILGGERLLAFLSTLLSGTALGLSAIGLYGVLAFSVARRTREIGVRMAVGGSRSGVVALFLREAAWIVSVGVLLGVPLALACGRAAQSLLFGLPPQDIGTIVIATVLLLAFAVAAAVIPALRAARLNVVRALRYE